MPAERSNPPFTLKLLPGLASVAPRRAAGYGLPFSAFVAALVWNDALRPDRALAALPREGKIVRQPLACSLRAAQRRLARKRAREQHISVNAYLEALIAAQLARPLSQLIIHSSES